MPMASSPLNTWETLGQLTLNTPNLLWYELQKAQLIYDIGLQVLEYCNALIHFFLIEGGK